MKDRDKSTSIAQRATTPPILPIAKTKCSEEGCQEIEEGLVSLTDHIEAF